jgi:hypothetical protein
MNYVVDTVKDIEKHADRIDEQRQERRGNTIK